MKRCFSSIRQPNGARGAVSIAIWLTLVSGLLAQEEESSSRRVNVSASPGGTQRFSRGDWTVLSVSGRNLTDSDREEVMSVYMGEDSSRQFAKQFWLPAGATRQSFLPVWVPESPLTEQQMSLSSMRLDESSGSEQITQDYIGMSVSNRSVMLTDQEVNTGLLMDRRPPDASGAIPEDTETLYAAIYAGRDSVVESPLGVGLITFNGNFLPPTPRALDELDQFILASDRIVADTAGLAQIRSWLRDGGRLWIMLDRTSESVVRALLGDEVDFTVVDRLELTDYDLASEATMTDPAISEPWSGETPVDFVRVLSDADDIPVRIDGWPAAIWQPVGRGEVLLTTLGARGWVKEEQLTAAYRTMCARVFELRNVPEPHAEALLPILDDQIGYTIPARHVAALVLGVNAVLLCLIGGWWARQRRLERLAFLIPVLAIISTVTLLAIGKRHATAVPSSVATGQLVQVFDSVGEAKVSTVRAIYSQDSGDLGLQSPYRTMTIPLRSEPSAGVARIRWDDTGASTWQGSPLPPGVLHATSDSTIQLADPIELRGTFDENGFVGDLRGVGSRSCSDALIVAAPGPATAVDIGADSNGIAVRGALSGLLAKDQFILGALLSDTQRMRQEALRQVLASPEKNPFGYQPSLLFWTEPFDLGVRFDDRFERGGGAALVSVPVRLRRPADGTRYQIPSTFVAIQPHAGSRGVTSTFNPRTGDWLAMTKPSNTELSVRFPKTLLPLSIETITVHFRVSAPSRSVVLMGRIDGDPVELFRQDSPAGQLDATLDRVEALDLDDDGGLWLSVVVTKSESEREREANQDASSVNLPAVDLADVSTWQIERLHVSATAVSQ